MAELIFPISDEATESTCLEMSRKWEELRKMFESWILEKLGSWNGELTKIRDELWNLLFRLEKAPNADDIRTSTEKYSKVISAVIPKDISNGHIKEKIQRLISSFLFPAVKFAFFGDPTFISLKIYPAKVFIYQEISQYIDGIIENSRIMIQQANPAWNVRNPFGFGSKFVVRIANARPESIDEIIASLKSSDLPEIEQHEKNLQKIFAGPIDRRLTKEMIHVLMEEENGFWKHIEFVYMPEAKSSEKEPSYPSPLQLRTKLMNCF